MVNNYYKTRYLTGTTNTSSISTATSTNSVVSGSTYRSIEDIELENLKRENSSLRSKLKQVEQLNNSLETKNNNLNRSISILKERNGLFLEAASFHVNVDDIKKTVTKLVTARKNKLEFENLLDVEVKYLFKHKYNKSK